jgi:hypothetical protein
MKSVNRGIARVLAVSMVCLGIPVPPAHAELVATDSVDASLQARAPTRERLEALLSRDEVRVGLERYGVSPSEAKARVDALSDDELERVAARLDSLPAGGDPLEVILVIAFISFIVLLVTDILGFTKVFPFTRKAK